MSLSCEIPSEEMKVCNHGVYIKILCDKCEFEHKINLLESRIKELERYKSLIDHLNNNRNDWREPLMKNECLIEHAQDGIEKCFERIEKLENELKDIIPRIWSAEQKGCIALDYIDGNGKFKNKKPHKCPVCNGSVKIMIDPSTPMSGIEAMFGKRDINGMYYNNCVACEGKGIVWG